MERRIGGVLLTTSDFRYQIKNPNREKIAMSFSTMYDVLVRHPFSTQLIDTVLLPKAVLNLRSNDMPKNIADIYCVQNA